jgi:hypothetical protein
MEPVKDMCLEGAETSWQATRLFRRVNMTAKNLGREQPALFRRLDDGTEKFMLGKKPR